MVCSLGSRRMAAMARLLAAGGVSQTIAEDVAHWNLATKYIQRELREADEANLLDEEDMHVFGLKPMTDPLHLVCCNACKKPVKVSRYAAHAELCKSLSSAEEIISELNGGTGNKKPPRKERKKSLTTSAITSVREQQRFENRNVTAASEPHSDRQIQMTSSFMDAKRNSPGVDGTLVDGSGVTGSLPPPSKRKKLIAGEGPLISDHLETASGVTKSLCISTQEALTCREYPNGSSEGNEKTCDDVLGCQMPRQVHGCYLPTKDGPAPLATKIYYSQRNQRLRSALSHLYYEASTKDHFGGMLKPQVLHSVALPSWSSLPKNLSNEQIDDQQEKRDKHSLPCVDKPDENIAQGSEAYLDKSGGGCPPAMNYPNQFSVNNVLGPHRTPNGLSRSNYLSNQYSFAGSTGKPLGTIQQPKGSVPVT
ncbi:hypothetical protein LguiA_001142 [Lonicera macranthoides]